MRKNIVITNGPNAAGHFSHAVVANGLVFVSGQIGMVPGTTTIPDNFAEQVRQCIRNMENILKQAGCGLSDIIKVNTYLSDATRFNEYNEVYKEFFSSNAPARTTCAAGLIGVWIEMDCIALLPDTAA